MQRTQIYFEESMLEELKYQASKMGISLSAYIRNVLKKDISNKKKSPQQKLEFSDFAGIWSDRDIDLADIRQKAWK